MTNWQCSLGRSAMLWLVVVVIGCGQVPGASHERYEPAPEIARSALESAMLSWQRGEPTGPLKNTQPALFIVDSHRRENQTLTGFEILGEVPGTTKRTFLVTLTLSNPDAEEKARYSVIGIDPLWVYRHEDLEMLAHWEHAMPAPPATSAEKQP